jgi:hypothetical protein
MSLLIRQQLVIGGIFLYWLVVFFPGWYALSYTKVRELRSLIGASRAEQLDILHPAGELASLEKLRLTLNNSYKASQTAILAPRRDSDLPQAHDASVLRVMFYPIPVLEPTEITADRSVIVVIESSAEHDEIDKCLPGVEQCACSRPDSLREKEVLCWHME